MTGAVTAASEGERSMAENLTAARKAMVELFQRHVDAELAGDLETTMATMTDDPHLNHVPVIAGFKGGKISHEHIYWDQAGVLAQVGLLKPDGLPVCGAEAARKVLDPKLPPRRF